jgi:hypothetical protein
MNVHMSRSRPSILANLRLFARVWFTFVRVQVELRRYPLSGVVERLHVVGDRRPHEPLGRLSRAVTRSLRVGPWQSRCLTRSLVLYRLVRQQGDQADLVIGLPDGSTSSEAHAWVEHLGRDIGPAPGGYGQTELVRYPSGSESRAGG